MTNGIKKQVNKYHPDMELSGSGDTDYGHKLADKFLEQKKKEGLEKRAELEYLTEFLKKSNKLNVEDVYSNRETKQELIRKYFNYTKLNGDGKEKKILSYCSYARIGLAFKSIYYSALNKIEKYGWGK